MRARRLYERSHINSVDVFYTNAAVTHTIEGVHTPLPTHRRSDPPSEGANIVIGGKTPPGVLRGAERQLRATGGDTASLPALRSWLKSPQTRAVTEYLRLGRIEAKNDSKTCSPRRTKGRLALSSRVEIASHDSCIVKNATSDRRRDSARAGGGCAGGGAGRRSGHVEPEAGGSGCV
ncbi:hypothetical protein EVAR_34511_1 [Eumeta japonica]|uniref:Uncharacterized protein n=1 Tax=Eumeta variegata TaxID=151549 RepID=A0A4C1Z874_EUMVA|nr:hypothetical protein EVAR_34511_1 [Eumeta japonica]